MNKKLLLSLTLLLLLLIGCSSTTQDEPQASPTVIVTETPVEMDDATTQDTEPTARQEVAAETPVEIEESATQDDAKALPQALPPDVVAEIQAEMDALTAGTMPPGMVAWIDAPEYQFAGASGSANLTDDTRCRQKAHSELAASPKMFTAVVIMQLAEDGVLTLDDSLTLWLPEVVEQLPYGDQITLRHLLTHTSGLFNVVEHEAYYADIFTEMVVDEATGNVTLDCVERDPNDTLARYVYGKEAQFEPGNSGATAIPTTRCSA